MQKSEQKEDMRVRRTRQMLRQALFELTLEKGFASVTVQDLAARATVNRSTFYRHYLDKYDLLDDYFEELEEEAIEAAAAAGTTEQRAGSEVPAGLLLVLRHVQQHADLYRVMLGPNGDQAFTHRFRRLTENRYRYLFSSRGDSVDPKMPPDEMRISYISHASVGAVLWWLEHNQPISVEQMATWIGQLNMTSAGIGSHGDGGSIHSEDNSRT